jgi:hypothetical protein
MPVAVRPHAAAIGPDYRKLRALRVRLVGARTRNLDGRIKLPIGESGGAVEHLVENGDVMIDKSRGELHVCLLRLGRQPQATGRKEMHA